MKKITITRALEKLKVLGSRIEEKVQTFRPISVEIGKKINPTEGKTKDEFVADTAAHYQSILDLMHNRQQLKKAIVQSNAVTEVTINNEVMTVAEAIARKTSIQYDKMLLNYLQTAYGTTTKAIEKHNVQVQANLQNLLQHTFQKESTKVKPDEYDAVAKPFLENNEARILDPLKIQRLIEKFGENIFAFEQEVNVSLAESNARTEVEIDI